MELESVLEDWAEPIVAMANKEQQRQYLTEIKVCHKMSLVMLHYGDYAYPCCKADVINQCKYIRHSQIKH